MIVVSEHLSYWNETRTWPICYKLLFSSEASHDEYRYLPFGLNDPKPLLCIFYEALKSTFSSLSAHSTKVFEYLPNFAT